MRRREFLLTLSGAAVVWPLIAHAQQALPVIAFLSTGPSEGFAHLMGAFRQGMGESGYVEGQNVIIRFVSAEGSISRFSALAAELVQQHVAVIVANGGTSAAIAAKSATTTIPVVFQASDDPVRTGLVASLNRPGGNLTGFARFGVSIAAKRFELFSELVPQAKVIGLFANPNNPDSKDEVAEIKRAVLAIGRQVEVFYAADASELDKAFETAHGRVAALYVASDAFYSSLRSKIVELAARHGIPASYDRPEFVTAGGLMSYASDRTESYHHMGNYVGKILKGTKPADLPVLQPSKFEFSINLKTAKALGLTVPASLLARADEVIE